jgi:hypothetical protein
LHKIIYPKGDKVRRGLQEVIIEVLEESPKSPKDLQEKTKQKALKEGSSFSTQNYYYHLKKLVDHGAIEKILVRQYRISDEEKQADPEEVLRIIGYLQKEKDEDVLKIYSESFYRLFGVRRGAHIPAVLAFIEKALEHSKFASPEVLKNLIMSLRVLLVFEKEKRKSPDKNTVQKINDNISRIEKIVKTNSNPEVIAEGIFFLAKTEEEKAAEIILELAEKLPEPLYQNIEHHIKAKLFKPEEKLFDLHKKLIMDKIIEMVRSKNLSVKKRGLNLEKAKKDLRTYA